MPGKESLALLTKNMRYFTSSFEHINPTSILLDILLSGVSVPHPSRTQNNDRGGLIFSFSGSFFRSWRCGFGSTLSYGNCA